MKKLSSMILALAMTLGCAQAVFADNITFLDVPADHWAYDDIAYAAQNGIVKGYYQEWTNTYTFAPENAVTYEEAATMLYRTLVGAGQVAGDVDTTALVAKYQEVLTQNAIAQWAQEYIAYLLDKDIVGEDELAAFTLSEGVGVKAPRMAVAIWTAKALSAEEAPVVYLPFADKAAIDDAEAGYVDILYRYGIMKGSLNLDGTITFNGNDGVKRSEFAAVANRVYKSKNAGAASSTAANIFSYSGDELQYLRYDNAATVIADGKVSSLTAERAAASATVVAGMVLPADSKAQIHFYSEPFVGEGTVKSTDKLSNDVTRVGIAVSGDVIYYILDAETETIDNVKIAAGSDISYIADGVKLIEVQE